MANLNNVIYLSERQAAHLLLEHELSTSSTTVVYSDNDLYLVQDTVDTITTKGSNNLITSGGVYNAIAAAVTNNVYDGSSQVVS